MAAIFYFNSPEMILKKKKFLLCSEDDLFYVLLPGHLQAIRHKSRNSGESSELLLPGRMCCPPQTATQGDLSGGNGRQGP